MNIKVYKLSEEDIDRLGLASLLEELEEDSKEHEEPLLAIQVNWTCRVYETDENKYGFHSDGEPFTDLDSAYDYYNEICKNVVRWDKNNYGVDASIELVINGEVIISKTMNTKKLCDIYE